MTADEIVHFIRRVGPVIDETLPHWSQGHREMGMVACVKALEELELSIQQARERGERET